MSDFSENFAKFRASTGLSRQAFADALGVKPDKIKHVETGHQRADHELLEALISNFDLDLNRLFSSDEDRKRQIFPANESSQFIPVTRYRIEASAGHGSLVQAEEGSGSYAYNKAFLERRGLKAENLAVIAVSGDSMEPNLRNGDLILVDQAQTNPAEMKIGHIYVVRFNDDLFVKRVQQLPGDRIQLLSSNPLYPPITISGFEADGVKIIGRVVNSTHEW